jgi:hypothetical protein
LLTHRYVVDSYGRPRRRACRPIIFKKPPETASSTVI